MVQADVLEVDQVDVLAGYQVVVVADLEVADLVVAVVLAVVVQVAVGQVVRKDNSNPVVCSIPSTELCSLVDHLEVKRIKDY